MFPPSLINPDQPPKSHRNKNRDITDQPRSQQGKKKKKTQINPDQNPDTATTRSMFPPSLINPDQPPKSYWNKNPNTADQPRSQQEKKKTHINPIKTQTPPPLSLLDQRFLHCWSTQINVSSTVMCDVDVGRRMMFESEERREQTRKREWRERREQK